MPLVNFRPAPGINKEVTDYTGEGKWTDGDNVRFFQGLPQKIKGWEKFISTTLVGVARDQHAWVALDGTRYNAVGTDRKLYVIEEGKAYDITPIRETQALTNPFTTNATTSVVVTDTSHGAQKGDFVTFDSFSTIDGLDMNKEFEITSVANNNAYVVTTDSAASGSTASGGGTGNAKYQISIGPETSVPAFGWGTDTWGASTWGTPRSTSNVTLEARQWSLDNFGEDLIATVLNGGAFKWDTSTGVSTRAAAISGAPTASRLSLVSTPDRHLVFMGTENTIGTTDTQDDLLIRFSDQEDITTYQPTAENTAGLKQTLASDVLQGAKDFTSPFDFGGVGESMTPFKDIGKELLSTATLAQVGQTPSQIRDASKALEDAERRYQEYINRLDEEQAASAAADMAARVAAYKEYMGLAGFTNAEIDAALVEAGYLASGETAFSQGGRVGFDTGGMTDSMGLGNYIEAEKVRTEFTDKIKRMLQAKEMNMKMNDPGLMRFANAMIPGGEGFYTREEMRFPSLKSKYESILQKFERDQAKDDYEREQIRKQMQETRKSEFDDIVNMIDDRFSDNRQQRKKANTGGRMTPEGDPISPDVPPGMQMDLRPGGFIPLGTAPKADDVPAMVGKNEFVLNDEAVSGIGKLITGKPDPRAGARALYKLQDEMEAIV